MNFFSRPVFSVIIPCFNVEQYVEECLDTVCTQTLDNIQIICVDDGSTDKTVEILNQRKKEDGRIKVIRQINKGVSVARNVGLAHAIGKYIYFLDSDDKIASPSTLEQCSHIMDKEGVDILTGGADTQFESKELEEKFPEFAGRYQINHIYDNVLTGSDAIIKLQRNKEWNVTPGLKVFRRGFLKRTNIRFAEGILHEDGLFTFEALFLAKRVKIVNFPIYVRRVRNDSIMTKKVTYMNTLGYVSVLVEELKFLEKNCHIRVLDECIGTPVATARKMAIKTYLRLDEQNRMKLMKYMTPEQRFFFKVFIQGEALLKEKLNVLTDNDLSLDFQKQP